MQMSELRQDPLELKVPVPATTPTPKFCGKELFLGATPTSDPQPKFAGKLIGYNQERIVYISAPIGGLGGPCFKHIPSLWPHVIS